MSSPYIIKNVDVVGPDYDRESDYEYMDRYTLYFWSDGLVTWMENR